jgi:hypothetical protein
VPLFKLHLGGETIPDLQVALQADEHDVITARLEQHLTLGLDFQAVGQHLHLHHVAFHHRLVDLDHLGDVGLAADEAIRLFAPVHQPHKDSPGAGHTHALIHAAFGHLA